MAHLEDVERFLIEEAEEDLRESGEAVPCLVALAGADPLLLAFVRPFARGEYHKPLIELFALAAPLAADRLVLSLTGRAWSMLDPIPPVDDELGDLRQRVLTIETADGAGDDVTSSTLILPFDLGAGSVRWGEPARLGAGEGWIPEAMARTVRARGEFAGWRPEQIRAQATRCLALGHGLALCEAAAERMGAEPLPYADRRC
jgi:hypothetical protein